MFGLFILTILFIASLAVAVLAWIKIRSFIIKLHYKKIASYLSNPHISMDSSVYGCVYGTYKNRIINWSITLTTNYRFIQTTSVKFRLLTLDKIKKIITKPFVKIANYGRMNRCRMSFFFEDNSVIFTYYNLFLTKEKILSLLERLNSITERFENGRIDFCFNCGEDLIKSSKKCQKCGYSWQSIES